MLKGIAPCLSPDLVHALLSMGHGDTIVIADGNFPAASHAQKLIRANGVGVVPILEGILKLFPLDEYDAQNAVKVMQVVPGDKNSGKEPPIWAEFGRVVLAEEGPAFSLRPMERFQFYEDSKRAYAIVATSETAIYANVILKKGIIKPKAN